LRKLVEKEVLETIGKEERKAFKEEHEVRANGYYQRDLLAPMGAIEDLQVLRRGFSPLLPGTSRAPPLQVRRADLCHVCRGFLPYLGGPPGEQVQSPKGL
jgi:hypothetical protein